MPSPPCLYTVGHSTRSAAELLALLDEADVRLLVDVRRFPGSRRHPQFAKEALAGALREVGVDYRHEPDLGGHRKLRGGNANAGIPEESLRAYADNMTSPAFRHAAQRLRREAAARTVVALCAEKDPARCHRKLLADHVLALGTPVVHLIGPGERRKHALSPTARLGSDGILRYPDTRGKQLDLFG